MRPSETIFALKKVAPRKTTGAVLGSSTRGNTSVINLRGLGADKTLILVNGRRMAGVSFHNTLQQPDLNGIPLSAIDRIEVLPSSASGIYGGLLGWGAAAA